MRSGTAGECAGVTIPHDARAQLGELVTRVTAREQVEGTEPAGHLGAVHAATPYVDPTFNVDVQRDVEYGAAVNVDGVPVTPDAADHDDVFVLRDFGSGGHGRWGRGGEVIVLCTDTDDPHAWLQAGQALGMVLLHLTLEDAAASPLGQVLDLPDSRAQLRALLGLGGHPQMVLRIGVPDSAGAPGRAAGRRPVSDVVDPG